MWPLYNQNIYPGPSSQTTNVKIENLVIYDRLNLSCFNAHTPIICRPKTSKWEAAAKEVLQEYADLWEKLSKL